MWSYLNSLEQPVMQVIVATRHPVLNSVFRGLTDLGTIVQAFILFGVIYLIYDEKLGVLGAASSITTSLVIASLKFIFQRDIPLQYAVQSAPDFLIPYGFPSGHTAIAFSTATVLYLELDRPGKYVIPVIAGTVGFSRLYLGVHYPSDIIVGAALGTIISYAFYKDKEKLYNIF